MEDFHFHAGPVPSGFQFDFEETLFNKESHRLLQSASGWQSFFVLNSKHSKVSASIHFHVEKGIAKSPLRSPYGCIECSLTLPPQVIYQFLHFAESELKKKGVSEMVIRDMPSLYRSETAALIQTFLFNLGFSVKHAEVSYVIQVNDQPFENGLHAWEKRKLKHSKQSEITVKKMPHDTAKLIYSFIHQCRTEKGYELSMSFEDLQHVMTTHPDHYILFNAFDKDKLIAGSVAIRVHQHILYNFYIDHASSYDHLSPVVQVIEALYDYCREQKIRILDLGTSALPGGPNFPLLDFKRHLGGKHASRLTFEKKL